MSGQGDNSQLKQIVERIEQINVEIKDLQTGRGEIYQEAKSAGFDLKALKALVAMRRVDASKRAEMQAILDTYMHAMGMPNA